MVGLELEIISRKVDRYGWDSMPDHVRDRLLSDWIDALCDFTLNEIGAAIKEMQATDPKKAVNEEIISGIVMRERGRRLAAIPKPAEPYRAPPDPETKARVDAVVRGFMADKVVTP